MEIQSHKCIPTRKTITDIYGEEHEATLINGADSPYLEYEYREVKKIYNPHYGDNRRCICGHSYYRHFDPYEDMEACGCKYCGCQDFKEDPASINGKKKFTEEEKR